MGRATTATQGGTSHVAINYRPGIGAVDSSFWRQDARQLGRRRVVSLSPLLGDGKGHYRVHIVGNSGTLSPPRLRRRHEAKAQSTRCRSWQGKLMSYSWRSRSSSIRFIIQSTTGAALGAMLGLPYISMDSLFWKPNWEEPSNEEFQAKLRIALQQDSRGWVADGNYDRRGGLVAFEQSTLCRKKGLDPPLFVYFPRVILRTVLRLLRISQPCAEGCNERFAEVFFSKASILWWCLSNHWKSRKNNRARMEVIGVEKGSDVERRRMRRFGGWGAEVNAWLADVAKMVQTREEKENDFFVAGDVMYVHDFGRAMGQVQI